jgi:monofunctional biosynthetic peptidoglycan transglycosylase
MTRSLVRLGALLLVSSLGLQLYFVLRVAAMALFDPQSTAFQRSEIARIWRDRGVVPWAQAWVDGNAIADTLKRAVIAAEDAGFVEHAGFDWEAIERAWERNQRAESAATRQGARRTGQASPRRRPPKIVGGSTITQQLAKNLFLTGERSIGRKAQEFVITWALETLLTKRRILEIYLNHVEWGEGVFGAQAAARHYYRIDASRVGTSAAARLAVMLPSPRFFERHPGSAYMASRAATITARMDDVVLP